MQPTALLSRLDAIGQSLAGSEHALALIGLGSVGQELARLDAYSDLDFFVIVEAGHKRAYLDDLGWLSAPAPLVFHFLNTPDGHKALYDDGIFCEFAVFELDELRGIPFAPGRIIWKRPHLPDELFWPAAQYRGATGAPEKSQEWLLGEILTNLYVGLGRDQRGERLSAMRFIQGYAIDRLVELMERVETPQPGLSDPFTPERRFEQRFPNAGAHLPDWAQGYQRNRESARAILAYLDQHFALNPEMVKAIQELT